MTHQFAADHPPAGRPPLSYERVVGAAINFIDDAGLAQLTMRSVGDVLGVEAMSLYRYVAGKDRLLYAIAERMVADIIADEAVFLSPVDGWQDFLERMAHGVRRAALAHPQAFTLVASLPTEATWLRPPLRTAPLVDSFLAGMTDQGFSDEAAVDAYQVFTAFLIGHLLLEVADGSAQTNPVARSPRPLPPTIGVSPHIERLSDHLNANTAEARFDRALNGLITDLSTRLAS